MEKNTRKSVNDKLSKYDYLSKDDDFIEITEWTNGEGFSVTINEDTYEFSRGQLEAIYYLTKTLEYDI